MTKAIIFGVSGQDGFYLAELLSKSGIEVIGVSRSAGKWLQGNVADRQFTEALIKKEQPAFIFHLAATSKVHHELLFEHQATIVNGTLHILEAVKQFSPHTKVFITGSGLQFTNTGSPISSEDEFFAGDAYSLARIQSVYAARYFRSKGVKTYVGYLFHHDSPLRTAQHMNRKIVDAAKDVAAGKPCTLSIGDVSVEKEFGFAGDIANGIFHLTNQEEIFEVCIGTGKAYTIAKWLELCFSSVGKEWKKYVQLNTGFVPEFKRLVSNPYALEATGWKARVDIDELSALMMKSTE
jgi:GDPmannose 4,6-dehydratase